MNGLHGIIFSYENPTQLGDLVAHRVPGSVPFAGDYRMIDFILSDLKNAGVADVGVIMHGKCQSLLDHLGTGKSWDLSRLDGGLKLLPAFAFLISMATSVMRSEASREKYTSLLLPRSSVHTQVMSAPEAMWSLSTSWRGRFTTMSLSQSTTWSWRIWRR